MDRQELHRTVIGKVLKFHSDIDEWKSFNPNPKSKLMDKPLQEGLPEFRPFQLTQDELPIFFSQTNENQLLITTDNIYSLFGGQTFTLKQSEFVDFDDEYIQSLPLDEKPKFEQYKLIGNSNQSLVYEVDSLHPARICITIILQCSHLWKKKA